MGSDFTGKQETPLAFSHPLEEGEKRLFGPLAEGERSKQATAACQPIPLYEGVPAGRGRLLSAASEGVPDVRVMHHGKAREPLPLHCKLYNPYLQPYASTLRKRMTKAECCLWKYVLRARKMKGYTFNRQRPVLRYIADFMCKQLQLIIEVDGSIHDDPAIKKHDVFRQSELESCGFTILRFTNEEVLQSISVVRDTIHAKINELEARSKKDCF